MNLSYMIINNYLFYFLLIVIFKDHKTKNFEILLKYNYLANSVSWGWFNEGV